MGVHNIPQEKSYSTMSSSATNARDLEQIVRDGLSSLVFAFGHKTGIVDAFTEIQQPCTAEELSQKAGKKLRLVGHTKINLYP